MVKVMPDSAKEGVVVDDRDSLDRAWQSTTEASGQPASVFWPACGALCDIFWWVRGGSRPSARDKA